jgi:hypothetical protein
VYNQKCCIHTDSAPVRTTDSRVCGWIITRTWTIRAEYHDCTPTGGVPRGSPVSTSQDQLIFIGDVTPPVFLPVPQAIRIPFFSNYETTSTIPSTNDPVSSYFQNIGLVSTPIVLTSRDSNFVRAKETDNQVQSQTDGLAHYTRTWTIADTCGNTHEAVQHIIIEHPGTSVQPVQSLLTDGAFSIAADVLQQDDPCRPGKAVSFGDKDYHPLPADTPCGDGQWKGDGCRIITRSETTDIHSVWPFKPQFLTFPDDADITTADPAPLPTATGEPTGTSFASTPFEIYHTGSCQNVSLLLAPCLPPPRANV